MTRDEQKRALRTEAIARRAVLSGQERHDAANGLVAMFHLERPFEVPCAVSGFWPMAEEIDIRPLMVDLHERGCRLALPVVVGKRQPLVFRAWQPGDALETGVFGTLHPAPSCEELEPDALIVPLLAVDDRGWRLGYGGGFYDRTLDRLRRKKKITAMGVAFDTQRVAQVPYGPDDQRLDWLLTDRRACAFV